MLWLVSDFSELSWRVIEFFRKSPPASSTGGVFIDTQNLIVRLIVRSGQRISEKSLTNHSVCEYSGPTA